jgi:hypothetical protein
VTSIRLASAWRGRPGAPLVRPTPPSPARPVIRCSRSAWAPSSTGLTTLPAALVEHDFEKMSESVLDERP